MSKTSLLNRKSKGDNKSSLKLLKSEHLPVLEKLLDSSRKLNRAANELIERIDPASRSIQLFIAGTGAVGGTLIRLIDDLESDFSFNIIGACDSDRYLWNSEGIAPSMVQAKLKNGERTEWNNILHRLTNHGSSELIFVDATGSAEVARLYPAILDANIHIATPSKRANTFEQSFYERLQDISKKKNVEFRYEPTVGAGLPVISTISDLLATGDTIHEISGVVSGTMTYLFNELEQGTPFSEAVRTARELGYAEPDPRDDLSGEDVARKFLTLARSIGLKVERSELTVESLVPDHLKSVNRETFLTELSEVDPQWKSNIIKAKKEDKTLRYVGKLTNNDISVGIQLVPIDSPLGRLSGTDNLFQITTKRYSNAPIVIQGPGAGKEVTAAGVLADILKIGKRIIVPER